MIPINCTKFVNVNVLISSVNKVIKCLLEISKFIYFGSNWLVKFRFLQCSKLELCWMRILNLTKFNKL